MTAPADWTLHHVGVAVADLDKAVVSHAAIFGQRLLRGPYHDPVQKVSVCFLGAPGNGTEFELVAPAAGDSPVASWLRRQIGAYHVCYEVDDLQQSLRHARAQRCMVLGAPAPAVAFAGRHIAWLFTPNRQLTELLERDPRAKLDEAP